MIKKRFKNISFSPTGFGVTKRLGWTQDTGDGYVIHRGEDIGFSIGSEDKVIDKIRFDKAVRKANNIILMQQLQKSKNIDEFLVNSSIFNQKTVSQEKRGGY